jgi:hypothetical protein
MPALLAARDFPAPGDTRNSCTQSAPAANPRPIWGGNDSWLNPGRAPAAHTTATMLPPPLKTDNPEEAVRWRRSQMVDENGLIPDNALMNAMQQSRALSFKPAAWPAAPALANGGELPDNGGLGGAWTWRGPGNIGGRLRAINIHPTTTTTMFAGSVSGGMWKTTDSGTSWAPVNDFMANLAITAIVRDPANAAVMYASTGEGFFNVDALQGAGIFKSIDSGTTWAQLAATAGSSYQYTNRIALSANGSILLAATNFNGIFRSIDGGAIFTNPLAGQRVLDIRFLPGSNTLAVAGGQSHNAWYTTDGGASWFAATGLGAAGGRVELGVGTGNIVYASLDHNPYNSNSGQVYQSTDGGQSYTLRSTPSHLSTQGWYDNVVWVDPTNPANVVVAGINIWKSTDSGGTFTRISGIHTDHHTLTSHPNYNGTTNRTVYLGEDGGAYVATDIMVATTGGGWQNLNNNLGVTQFYGAAAHAGTGRIMAGAQDNGTLTYNGATGTWTSMFGGDGGWCASDPTDSNYWYGEYVYLNIHRSSNGGGPGSGDYISGQYWNGSAYVWKAPPYRIDDAMNSTANFISPFIIDPNNANRILGGGASLWRTSDAKTVNTTVVGPTWAAIKASTGLGNIYSIAVAPGNSDIIWVGHGNGDIYRTANGTAVTPVWVKVDIASLPNRAVLRLAIDPLNSNRVYAAFGGFNADNLWRTIDNGVSWADVSGPLPSAPIRSVVIHPDDSNYVYVGTEVGVFGSGDNAATWSPSNEGPANVSVDELLWMDRTLVAATHGRGVFTIPLPLSCAYGGLTSATNNSTATCNIDLGWSAATVPCGSPLKYNVYRSTTSGFTPGPANRIASCQTGNSYSDQSVTSGIPYYYVTRFETPAPGSGPCGGTEDTNVVQRTATAGGTSTVTAFSDTFESGSGLNGWGTTFFSTANGNSAVDWIGIEACTAHGGTKDFRNGSAGCAALYNSNKWAVAYPVSGTGVAIPAGATATRLNFWHKWDYEFGYDGAHMLVSTDGTNYYAVPGAAFLAGGYGAQTLIDDAAFCGFSRTGGGGWSIWTGTSTVAFTNVILDLDAACNAIPANVGGCAGKSVRIGFTENTDCSGTQTGWFLDDVQVTYTGSASCSTATVPAEVSAGATTLRLAKNGANLNFTWQDLTLTPQDYNLYQGTLGTWYSHSIFNCHLTTPAITCSAGSCAIPNLAPGSASRYFLVNASGPGGEGNAGGAGWSGPNHTSAPVWTVPAACGGN